MFSKLPAHSVPYNELQFYISNTRWRDDVTPQWFQDIWDRYVSQGPHILWCAVATYVCSCESAHQNRRTEEKLGVIKDEFRIIQRQIEVTGDAIFKL